MASDVPHLLPIYSHPGLDTWKLSQQSRIFQSFIWTTKSCHQVCCLPDNFFKNRVGSKHCSHSMEELTLWGTNRTNKIRRKQQSISQKLLRTGPLILNLKGVDALLYICVLLFLDALGFCAKYRRSWLHHFVWGQFKFEEGWFIWFLGK